jgi:hypothetical protein
MVNIYVLEKNNIPFYVGKSTHTTQTKNAHKRTYGKDITFYVVDETNEQEWKFWESYWIEQFQQWGFILENKNQGGGGPTQWTEEQKHSINPIRVNKIKNHPTRGSQISSTLKSNNHSQYYTQEVNQKISKGNKGIPKPFTQEHITNMGIAKLKQAKPVLQFDLEGNFIREWESKGQAAKSIKQETGKTGNLASQIKDCILGRQKTALGYKWKYKQQ